MSIEEIDKKLIILGNGLLNKKKYDFDFSYNKFDFLSIRFAKKRIEKLKLTNNIYKRL